MSTVATELAPQPRQLAWLKTLLAERGIDHEPTEIVNTAAEASKLIQACLSGRVGVVQPITEAQLDTIRRLQEELGPRLDDAGNEIANEMPTDRAGANKLIRALQRVKFARLDDTLAERLAEIGVTMTSARSSEPEVGVQVTTASQDEIPF